MKKVNLFLVFLFIFFSSVYLNAQWARVYESIKMLNSDSASSIQQTSDGGYIAAGATWSVGAGECDVWIIKLFSNGTIEWQRTYGGTGRDRASSIQQTSDGGYIVAGETWTWGAGANDAWIIKLASNGAIEWQWTYGGADIDSAHSVQETSDGGYIVAGTTDSFGAGDNDFWVIKLTAAGAVEWQRTYGGSGNDHVKSIQETSGGGYIVAGNTNSFGAGKSDFWVIKLTSTGNVEWQRTYGGSDTDLAQSIRETTDGGYAVAGYTGSFGAGGFDVWVLKISSTGIFEWQRTFGKEGYDQAYSIWGTDDGGCVVAGVTGSGDIWVIKLTSMGAVGWQRTFGGEIDDHASSIQQTSDGGYAVAGSSGSFGDALGDALVFKLDANGGILPSCGYLGIFDATIADTSASFSTPSIVTHDTTVTPSITIASADNTDSSANLLCGSPEYILAISSSYGGTTDPSPGGYPYTPGAEATVNALPSLGYMFTEWTGDVPSGDKYDNPLTILMNSDKSIKANFVVTAGNYELTINTALGGTTDPAPGKYSHPAGTEVCITAGPDPGNSFLSWGGDVPAGHENDNPLCMTMNSNKSVTPQFRFPAKPWTFIVYLDGDNSSEAAGIDDFLEMAVVGSDANVNIVVQFDRIGGSDSDTRCGNWTSTKRFYVKFGLAPTPENALEDLGELNQGDPQTLQNFINWTKARFPATHYALILWNNGAAWRWLCEDSTSSADALSMDEVQSALSSSGGIDLIGFDAALMGMAETAYEIRSNGQVMVGSEESIPLAGWPYTAILQDLEAYPVWQASEFGMAIVNRYYESYNNKQTLSAVNLSNMNALASTISTFAQTMIDSWNTNQTAVKNAAQSVMAEIENAVIHEKHGSSWPGAHGLAIYFPEISDEFSSDYNGTNLDFLADTQWEEFLQEFLSSMGGSWIGQRRAGSQQFFYPQNIDLYDFCNMLNLIEQDSYAESSASPEWAGGGTAQGMDYLDDYTFLHNLPFDFPFFDEIIPAGTYLTI